MLKIDQNRTADNVLMNHNCVRGNTENIIFELIQPTNIVYSERILLIAHLMMDTYFYVRIECEIINHDYFGPMQSCVQIFC